MALLPAMAVGTSGVKPIKIQENFTTPMEPRRNKVNGNENAEAHRVQRKFDLPSKNSRTQTWANIVTGNKLELKDMNLRYIAPHTGRENNC